MARFARKAGQWRRKSAGATAAEAALLVGLIAVAIIGAVALTGVNLARVLGDAAEALGLVEPIADFDFADSRGIAPGTEVTSAPVTLSGMRENGSLTATPSGAVLLVDGAEAAAGTELRNGSTVALRMTAPTEEDSSASASLSIGTLTARWSVFTTDRTPDAIAFAPTAGAPGHEEVRSAVVALAGFDGDIQLTANVSGAVDAAPEVSVNGGASWSAMPLSIAPSATPLQLQLRLTTGPADGSSAEIAFAAGKTAAIWTVTTRDLAAEEPILVVASPTDYVDPFQPDTAIAFLPFALEGFDAEMPVSVAAEDGASAELRVLDGTGAEKSGWGSAATILPGDSVELRGRSPAAERSAGSFTFTYGELSLERALASGNSRPDAFTFTPVEDASPATPYVTPTLRLSGFDIPAAISIAGPAQYSIAFGPWMGAADAPGLLRPGEGLRLQATSGPMVDAPQPLLASLTVGGEAGEWSVTTADMVPDGFADFTALSGVPLGTVGISAPQEITGIVRATPFSVVGVDGATAYLRVNGGSLATSGTVPPEATVEAAVEAANTLLATTAADITIGGVTRRFQVTSAGGDSLPDDLDPLEPLENQEPNAAVTSLAILPEGYDTALDVWLSDASAGAAISIADRPFTTGGRIYPGQSVTLQLITADYEGAVQATLNIGRQGGTAAERKSVSWSAGTRRYDATPDSASIAALTALTEQPGSQWIASAVLSPSGFDDPVAVSVSGEGNPQLNIAGRGFLGSSGTLRKGETLQLRLTSGIADAVTRTATLQLGGSLSRNWSVTTYDWTPDAHEEVLCVQDCPACGRCMSGYQTYEGYDRAAPFSGEGSLAFYVGNSGGEVRSGSLPVGETLRLRVAGANGAGEERVFTYRLGDRDYTFRVRNEQNLRPSNFTMNDVGEAVPGVEVISDPVTVSGAAGTLSLGTAGGYTSTARFSVNDGPFVLGPVSVENGDSFRISFTPPAANTLYNVSVRISVAGGSVTADTWTVSTQARDALPNLALRLTAFENMQPGETTLQTVTPSGYNVPLTVSGTVQYGSGPQTPITFVSPRLPEQLQLNKSMDVRIAASSVYGETGIVRLQVGEATTQYTIHTRSADQSPAAFDFGTPVTGADPATPIESRLVTVAGIDAPIRAWISGDETAQLQVNGGAWQAVGEADALTVPVGAGVKVRVTSGPPDGTPRTATLYLGGTPQGTQQAEFSVATADRTPDAGIAFPNSLNREPNGLIASATVTVGGVDAGTPVSVSATAGTAQVQIGSTRASAGTITGGQTLRLWLSGLGHDTQSTVTASIGTASYSWQVGTRALDTAPDTGLEIAEQADRQPGERVTSASIRPLGFADAATVTVSGPGEPLVSVDGGPFVASAELQEGQTLRVQMAAPLADDGSAHVASVDIGGASTSFTVRSVDWLPAQGTDSFGTTPTDADRPTSPAVALSGYTPGAPWSLTGTGAVLILNGVELSATSGTLPADASVALRVDMADTLPGASRQISLLIGSTWQAPWTVVRPNGS